MAKLTRSQQALSIVNNIFTNTMRLIKGNTEQAQLINLNDSCVNLLDDANVNNGYLAIDNSGRVNISFITAIAPSGKFLRDDGTWQAIVVPNYYAVTTSATPNAYVAIISAITSYSDGMDIGLFINSANTGAATLQVNSLSALTILLYGTEALDANYFKNGLFVRGIVQGSNFLVYSVTANIAQNF